MQKRAQASKQADPTGLRDEETGDVFMVALRFFGFIEGGMVFVGGLNCRAVFLEIACSTVGILLRIRFPADLLLTAYQADFPGGLCLQKRCVIFL